MATTHEREVLETLSYDPIYYQNGNIVINNVEHHNSFSEEGYLIDKLLPGEVAFKVSIIAEYMQENGLRQFDFNDYDRVPVLEQRLNELFEEE